MLENLRKAICGTKLYVDKYKKNVTLNYQIL